jgi:integrase
VKNFASKFAPIIKEYLEHRKMLGYSDLHERYLLPFDRYCQEFYPNLETLTKELVRNWVSYEISRGRGGMYNTIKSIRTLALYMGNGAYVLPYKAVPKQPKCVPYILSDEELSRFFMAADNFEGRVDHLTNQMIPTLLRLQYTCGLRPHEVRLIKRENINFDSGEILLEKTKGHRGHKERIVVMSDDMLQLCSKYDTVRTIMSPQSEYFFVRANSLPVSNQQLIGWVKRCWQQANPGIAENMLPRLRPYDLRHRFASAILQKWICEGEDLYAMLPYLREFMGHAEFSSTAYYIHLLPENLLNSHGIDWSRIDGVDPEVDIWK